MVIISLQDFHLISVNGIFCGLHIPGIVLQIQAIIKYIQMPS